MNKISLLLCAMLLAGCSTGIEVVPGVIDAGHVVVAVKQSQDLMREEMEDVRTEMSGLSFSADEQRIIDAARSEWAGFFEEVGEIEGTAGAIVISSLCFRLNELKAVTVPYKNLMQGRMDELSYFSRQTLQRLFAAWDFGSNGMENICKTETMNGLTVSHILDLALMGAVTVELFRTE